MRHYQVLEVNQQRGHDVPEDVYKAVRAHVLKSPDTWICLGFEVMHKAFRLLKKCFINVGILGGEDAFRVMFKIPTDEPIVVVSFKAEQGGNE